MKSENKIYETTLEAEKPKINDASLLRIILTDTLKNSNPTVTNEFEFAIDISKISQHLHKYDLS